MNKIISWVGTVTSITGAFLVAFGIAKMGYFAFIIGSFSWLFIGAVSRNKPLIVLNATFFIANLIGVYRVFAV